MPLNHIGNPAAKSSQIISVCKNHAIIGDPGQGGCPGVDAPLLGIDKTGKRRYYDEGKAAQCPEELERAETQGYP